MASRRPYWCFETKERRPYWCTKTILRELNSVNQYGHRSGEGKRSISVARIERNTTTELASTTVGIEDSNCTERINLDQQYAKERCPF